MTGTPTSADVLEAANILAPLGMRTPLVLNQRLSALCGTDVFLKREDLSLVRSYKGRGARVAVEALKASGHDAVVCASAGNHAQGVAAACAALSMSCSVVVPVTTPRQKRERILALNPNTSLIVAGRTYDESYAHAVELSLSSNAALIPAFDHPSVIAGQGTVALEVLEDLHLLGIPSACMVAPVGGGGLLAGSALALTGTAISLIGVEPENAASWRAARKAGQPVSLSVMDSFVDGAAVARVGALPFAIASNSTTVLQVPEGAVATAMLELYQQDGIIAEPAGALALAAVPQVLALIPNQPLVLVISGGNNDVSRYAEVLERSLVFQGIKQYFLLEFDQVPGALRRFLDSALGPGDDIVLFEYVKKSNRESGPALVGIELSDPQALEALQRRMTETGIRFERVEPGSSLQRFLV